LLERLGDDAAKWAAEFRKTAIKLGYSDMDEGWLIGWFANAIENAHRLRTSLTAAAQVGEQDAKERHDAQVERYVILGRAVEARAIERCAQVAENFYHEGAVPFGLRAEIAAAIRKLKETA